MGIMEDLDFGDLGGGVAGGSNMPNLSGFGNQDFGQGLGSSLANFNFQAPQATMNTDPFGGGGGGAFDWSKLSSPGQGSGDPSGGGGGLDMQGVLGGIGGVLKGVAPLAQTGLGALSVKNQLDAASLARKQAKRANQMQDLQQKSVQPLTTFGQQQLQQAQGGQVDPSVEAMIQQWIQKEQMQMKQQFAHMGITDSTMMKEALAGIEAKGVSMRASVLGQDKQTAIQALSAAMQGAGQGAQTASREQQVLDNMIAESNKALAALTGSI